MPDPSRACKIHLCEPGTFSFHDQHWQRFIAGLIASTVLSGVVLLAAAVGIFHAADPVQAVSGIVMTPPGLGWVIHFSMGALVWGSLFALLSPVLPGPFWGKGTVFGAIAWLLMALLIWASDHAFVLPITLGSVLLHLLFGATTGLTYGSLIEQCRAPSAEI